MAYFVAKVLKMRPSEILDYWGTAELIVAYGEYANEIAMENYERWKSLDAEQRAKVERPEKYAVYFHRMDQGINGN